MDEKVRYSDAELEEFRAIINEKLAAAQTLYDELPDPPPNLKIIYGDMGEALDRTDLLVTVSSTAYSLNFLLLELVER